MVAYTKWPYYFEKYGLKEPRTGNYVPSTFAWGCEDKDFWEMMNMYPKRLKYFNQSMATLDEVLPVTGMYDFSWIGEKAKSGDQSRTLIVDVGSGKGQALKRIMESCSDIPASRLVMQDRPIVIEEAENSKDAMLMDVKKMPHDFFKEQPVKGKGLALGNSSVTVQWLTLFVSAGALVYYIRRIIHDWHDDNCAIILGQLAKVMEPDSRVLICEQIMSNPPTRLNAQTDLCMLGLGAKERTEKMFEELVPRAGLKLIKIWKSKGTDVGVVECEKASS
jgi:O-methyltransferase domain